MPDQPLVYGMSITEAGGINVLFAKGPIKVEVILDPADVGPFTTALRDFEQPARQRQADLNQAL